jgi:hypothetical protein
MKRRFALVFAVPSLMGALGLFGQTVPASS